MKRDRYLNNAIPQDKFLELVFNGRDKIPHYQRIIAVEKENGKIWLCAQLIRKLAVSWLDEGDAEYMLYRDRDYFSMEWIEDYFKDRAYLNKHSLDARFRLFDEIKEFVEKNK